VLCQPVHVRQIEAAAAVPHVQRVQMALASYVGDIHGARALAAVSFERLYNYVVVSGQIRSAQFLYTFRAELVGYSGFGEMVSHVEGTRFQIKIDLTPDPEVGAPLGKQRSKARGQRG
jgi:hypothetical protein